MSEAAQRRTRYRADARRSILDAAQDLLMEGGFEAVTMRRLAERCGYSAPTLYHYFRDKPGLIQALLEERLQLLAAELRAVEPSSAPAETIRRLGAAFARFGLRNPAHYQLLVVPQDGQAPDPPSQAEVERMFLEPLEELARQGDLSEDRLETLRQGLWCLLHGLILLQTTRPADDWQLTLLDDSIDALIRGALHPDAKGGTHR